MRPFCRRPSAALVVACLALFVSLSGTSFADVAQVVPRNSVGTPQLRNSAVTTPTIRNGSVTLAKLAPNARIPGPAGAAGPQGPKGDKGEKGDTGAAGLTGLERRGNSSVSDSTSDKTVQVACPSGTRALSGGGAVQGASGSAVLRASYPSNTLTSWFVSASEVNPTAASWSLTAFVVCGAVG